MEFGKYEVLNLLASSTDMSSVKWHDIEGFNTIDKVSVHDEPEGESSRSVTMLLFLSVN